MDNKGKTINSFDDILIKLLSNKGFGLSVSVSTLLSIAFYLFIFKIEENNNYALIYLILFLFIAISAIIYLNCYFIGKIIDEENENQISKLKTDNQLFLKKCEQCAIAKVESDSFLAYYNLIKFDELMKIERSLNKDDETIVYTSHIGTEDRVQDDVKNNIAKGVKYNIFFYNGSKEKEKLLRDNK